MQHWKLGRALAWGQGNGEAKSCACTFMLVTCRACWGRAWALSVIVQFAEPEVMCLRAHSLLTTQDHTIVHSCLYSTMIWAARLVALALFNWWWGLSRFRLQAALFSLIYACFSDCSGMVCDSLISPRGVNLQFAKLEEHTYGKWGLYHTYKCHISIFRA